jgi:aminoglycoside N3'-acetyltransferase
MTRQDFEAHLEAVGLHRGMKLAVHSRLITFGRIEGGVVTVYEALRRFIGEEGTIVLPTYTFYLDADTPYDPALTPSREVGALAEYGRQRPGMRRTLCPMHGHAVCGPASQHLLDADISHSLGEGSAFEAMHEAGFHLLLLGCTFLEGATFVHHVEATAGVPYREWLDLHRVVKDFNGSLRRIKLQHFGLPTDSNWEKDFWAVEPEMTRRKSLTTAPINGRASHLMKLADLHDAVSQLIADDPYVLVKPGERANCDC